MACPDGHGRCQSPGTGRKSPIAGSQPRLDRHDPLPRSGAARHPGSSRVPATEINWRASSRHRELDALSLIVTSGRDASW
jgi:hypothetical protein